MMRSSRFHAAAVVYGLLVIQAMADSGVRASARSRQQKLTVADSPSPSFPAAFASESERVQPLFRKPVLPATFNRTAAQIKGKCAQPLMAALGMYLTPTGASSSNGQWGKWQLTDEPGAVATASWNLDFMAWDWQTVRIYGDSSSLAIVAKPATEHELEKTYKWRAQGSDGFSEGRWDFMLNLMAPNLAWKYDKLNYSVSEVKGSYPRTLDISPKLEETVFPRAAWKHWAVTDCKDDLVAVLKVEDTGGKKPGRLAIFNKDGEKAADVLPNPAVGRYQFLDVNEHLLATAETPALGSDIPLSAVPRREALGNVLPYALHFELGGYNFSSDLLKDNLRWIIGTAVQVRALQDAHSNFEPPFVRDRYFLLAIALASGLVLAILVMFCLTGSVKAAWGIFFLKEKATPGFHPAPMPQDSMPSA